MLAEAKRSAARPEGREARAKHEGGFSVAGD
jgi:hypothetical protein